MAHEALLSWSGKGATDVKIGIIGDAHLGATRYSRKRRADFSQAFINALQLCKRHKAEVVCLLGDVFDSAATRRSVDAFATILSEIASVLQEVKRRGMEIIAIPGNHEFGRGREAGELKALEELGFIRVLRCETTTIGDVGICGIPWQSEPQLIPGLAADLRRQCKARTKILLLHNFIHGSQHIPRNIAEVDASVAQGFARGFAGHHHVYEHIGNIVIPGSTEIENMLDESEKCIVIYDSASDRATRHALPMTHRTIILHYDVTEKTEDEIASAVEQALEANGGSGDCFLYIKLHGTLTPGVRMDRSSIERVLRNRNLFSHYIDLAYTSTFVPAPARSEGASIEQLLARHFKRGELKKARAYLDANVKDEYWRVVAERILS
jgi:predicted phosphodiesterase